MKKETYGFLIALGIVAVVGVMVLLIGKRAVSSYSTATIRNGEVFSYGTGEDNDTSEIMYEAGSNGKMITAYLCLKLAEKNMISLDDPITAYLSKEWITDDVRMSDITIRDLLSHQAGFSPSFEFGVDKKIYFAPGSHFCYSGVGYIYLQQIIESVTGESFEQAAREYVFTPLDMQQSTFQTTSTVTPYVSSSSFVLYSLVVWFALGILVFLIGLVITAISRFQLYSLKALFYSCVAISYLATLGLQLFIIPRMAIPFLITGFICGLILFFTKDCRFAKYGVLLISMVVFIICSYKIQFFMPLGPAVDSREPNAAYSFITDTKDMTLFVQQLLLEYQKQTPQMRELFLPQVAIDERNAWGAGCAIETEEGGTTYWHSGINPGMQSLIVMNPEQGDAVIVMTNSDLGLDFAKQEARDILGINGIWDIVRTDLKTVSN